MFDMFLNPIYSKNAKLDPVSVIKISIWAI